MVVRSRVDGLLRCLDGAFEVGLLVYSLIPALEPVSKIILVPRLVWMAF